MFNWLREKLGIEEDKEAFEKKDIEFENSLRALQEDFQEHLVEFTSHAHGDGGTNPPPPQPSDEYWDRKTPVDTWPKKFNGVRVGYVKLVEKAPLYYVSKRSGIQIYQDDNLRPDVNTTDGKRIVSKPPYWFMVYWAGDVWGHGEPRPFGEHLDGDDLYYKVKHEQIIDGIKLWERELPELYIHFKAVGDKYVPS